MSAASALSALVACGDMAVVRHAKDIQGVSPRDAAPISPDEIAKQLGLREQSVKEHLSMIFAKIGAANRAEAVGIAMRKLLLKV